MRLRHIGYACQNLTLETRSRTVRKANLSTEALIPVIAQNLDDILAMLRWNARHDLRFLRISSDLIPFGPLPEFPFDWAAAFKWKFDEVRRVVKSEALRQIAPVGSGFHDAEDGIEHRAVVAPMPASAARLVEQVGDACPLGIGEGM